MVFLVQKQVFEAFPQVHCCLVAGALVFHLAWKTLRRTASLTKLLVALMHLTTTHLGRPVRLHHLTLVTRLRALTQALVAKLFLPMIMT